jgi:hypothetical protein
MQYTHPVNLVKYHICVLESKVDKTNLLQKKIWLPQTNLIHIKGDPALVSKIMASGT